MKNEELELMCEEAYARKNTGDLEGARELWQRAAAQGSGRALNSLGADAHARGDIAEAKRLFSLATTAEPPDAMAMYNLGVLAHQDGEADLALRYFENAGENGHADGAYNRGQAARLQGDMETAGRWWQRAAELGHGSAAFNLGILASQNGDTPMARTWFERAADLGHADGMTNVGAALRAQGDHELSREYFERAAAAGSALAMYNLSEIAENEHKHADAIAWMRRAAGSGDEQALRELARLQVLAQLEDSADVSPLARNELDELLETLRTAAYRDDLKDEDREKYFATYVRFKCREPETYMDLSKTIAQCEAPLLLDIVIANLDASNSDDSYWDECVESTLLNPAASPKVILGQAQAAQWDSDLFGTLTRIVFLAASRREDISYLDLASLTSAYLTSSVDHILFQRWEYDMDTQEDLFEDLRDAFLQFQRSHPPTAIDLVNPEDLEDEERLALAAHPMTPAAILRALAADESPDVRRFTSANPSSDEETRAIAAILR